MDILKEPTVLIGVICIPFIVIAIAKNWQRIKEKKAAAAGGEKPEAPQS